MNQVVRGFIHRHIIQSTTEIQQVKQACMLGELEWVVVAVYLVRWHLLFLHINQFGVCICAMLHCTYAQANWVYVWLWML